MAVFVIAAAFSPRSPSSGRSPPLLPDIAGEIVGEIGDADLGTGAGDTDGAHKQAHAGFLLREDVLDESPDFGAPAIGARSSLAHRTALWLLVVDVGEVAVLLQPRLVLLRAIGGVGPHCRAGVILVQHIAELRPSQAEALVTVQPRIKPCRRSIEAWFL